MSSEKRKIAYIDGKPYEIGPNHTSILKFVKSYLGEKKVPTLCDDPNLAPYGACRVCSVEVALEKDGPTKVLASCHTPVGENQHIFTNSKELKDLPLIKQTRLSVMPIDTKHWKIILNMSKIHK